MEEVIELRGYTENYNLFNKYRSWSQKYPTGSLKSMMNEKNAIIRYYISQEFYDSYGCPNWCVPRSLSVYDEMLYRYEGLMNNLRQEKTMLFWRWKYEWLLKYMPADLARLCVEFAASKTYWSVCVKGLPMKNQRRRRVTKLLDS